MHPLAPVNTIIACASSSCLGPPLSCFSFAYRHGYSNLGRIWGFRTYSEVSRAAIASDTISSGAGPQPQNPTPMAARFQKRIADAKQAESATAMATADRVRDRALLARANIDFFLSASSVNVTLLGLNLVVTTAIAAGAWFIVPASRRRKREAAKTVGAAVGSEPDVNRFFGGRDGDVHAR